MSNRFHLNCTQAFEAIKSARWAEAKHCLSNAKAALGESDPQYRARHEALLARYRDLLTSRTRELAGPPPAPALPSPAIAPTVDAPRPTARVRVSFVTSVFNRGWQLRQTLPRNLAAIRGLPGVEIVIADFGGADSDKIARFIDREFSFDLLRGSLRYFQLARPWTKFHMAAAKNAAHRLARGEFLMSLDADNLITADDAQLVLDHAETRTSALLHQTRGPAPIAHKMWAKYQLFPDADTHEQEITWDGSCGRIGVPRHIFEAVNGYNENLLGMGMDDIDFSIRCLRAGAEYRHVSIARNAREVFLPNKQADDRPVTTVDDAEEHSNNQANWRRMDELLARGINAPRYEPLAPPSAFREYRPRCVRATENARVTLFANAFRAGAFLERFTTDVKDIQRQTSGSVIWVFDICPSNPLEVTRQLATLADGERIFYIPVSADPGLYAVWNIALHNIRSEFVGNLNIDDLRGPDWLNACLDPLESGLADIASPVTVPFKDSVVASYDAALQSAVQAGERWFDQRQVFDGAAGAGLPRWEKLQGDYFHEDLFQVLPDDRLASFCIPNASPVWRRVIHERVGGFDENADGAFADLSVWVRASKAGFRLRQVDYPALFFVSADQAHRRQENRQTRLWKMAHEAASPGLRRWLRRRSFDLSRIGGTYGDHHFLGWNWVRDQVAERFVHTPGNILLDMFVERTFCWNPKPEEKDFVYTRDWIGFVHTTPHSHPVYQHKGQNLEKLLADDCFIRSLKCCRGLIVLSERNRTVLTGALRSLGASVPVYKTFHPNIPVPTEEESAPQASQLRETIFHVGWHLRSFAAFARLPVSRESKVLLVPAGLDRTAFLKDVVNADLGLAGLGDIEEYAGRIYTASREEYAQILHAGNIFNCYVEPAGSNLISECISASTCLMLNRHPVFEEYLGRDYPLFYDTPDQAASLAGRLLFDGSLSAGVRVHLARQRERLSIDNFCNDLVSIGAHAMRVNVENPRSSVGRPT